MDRVRFQGINRLLTVDFPKVKCAKHLNFLEEKLDETIYLSGNKHVYDRINDKRYRLN